MIVWIVHVSQLLMGEGRAHPKGSAATFGWRLSHWTFGPESMPRCHWARRVSAGQGKGAMPSHHFTYRDRKLRPGKGSEDKEV